MNDIKEICQRWKDNYCVHCGEKMESFYDKSDNIDFKCKRCVWNDSQHQNTYKAMVDISEMMGVIFWLTGSSGEKLYLDRTPTSFRG